MATVETKTITLNGNEYSIEQFSGKRGIPLMRDVLKVVAPVIPILVEVQESGDLYTFLGYTGEIFSQFNDELIQGLLANTSKGKYNLDIDKDFAGEYDTLILLLIEVIKFNWGKSLKRLLEEAGSVLGG